MKTYLYFLSLAVALAAALSSCEEDVVLDLGEHESKVFVEAKISNLSDSATVDMVKSLSYYDKGAYPPVRNAKITITAEDGTALSLVETGPGHYAAPYKYKGEKQKYFLTIESEGKTYKGMSEGGQMAMIDAVELAPSPFPMGQNAKDTTRIAVVIKGYVRDPGGVKNYYRALFYKNDSLFKGQYAGTTEDNLFDGRMIPFNNFERLRLTDTVTIEAQNIDAGTYTYFMTTDQLLNASSSFSTPDNPKSNINNGTLGYFSVFWGQKVTFCVGDVWDKKTKGGILIINKDFKIE